MVEQSRGEADRTAQEVKEPKTPEYVLFGPFGRERFSANSQEQLRLALEREQIRPEDRLKFWQRVEHVIAAVQSDPSIFDVVQTLEQAVDRERKAMLGTSPEATLLTAMELDRKTKHEESLRLIREVLTTSRSAGTPLPIDSLQLQLLPVIQRVSDLFSTLEDVGESALIQADHREVIRLVIEDLFNGKKIQIRAGLAIDATPEIVTFLSRTAGVHENNDVETQWHNARIRHLDSDPTVRALALSMDFLLLSDKFPGVVSIKVPTEGGTGLIEINDAAFTTCLSLMERELRALTFNEKVAKEGLTSLKVDSQYPPSAIQVAQTCIDFIESLDNISQDFQYSLPSEVYRGIVQQCIQLIERTRYALLAQPESEARRKKLGPLTIGVIQLKETLRRLSPMVEKRGVLKLDSSEIRRAENNALAQSVTDIMQNRAAMISVADASARRYLERERELGHPVDEQSNLLTPEEKQLILRGREAWGHQVDDQTRAVESFARNTVGAIQLARLLSLMEHSSQPSVSGLSITEKLQLLSLDPAQFPPDVRLLAESASRGSHAGWYTTALMMGREEVAQAMPFEQETATLRDSDWLQIRSAAEHMLRYLNSMEGVQNINLDVVFSLIKNRQFLIQSAQATDSAYRQRQREKYQNRGEQVPSWVEKDLFTPEQLQILSVPGTGFTDNPVNKARVKYAQNAISFAALQEGILDLARINEQSALEIVDTIISNRMHPEDIRLLASLQKSAYLQLQMFRGRIDSPSSTIDVTSLNGNAEDPNVQTDWALVREAAIIFKACLPEGAYAEQSTGVDFSVENLNGARAAVINTNTPPEMLNHISNELGLQVPDHMIIFSGGAALTSESGLDDVQKKVSDLIRSKTIGGKKVLVTTGGADQGYIGIAGRATQQLRTEAEIGENIQALGVARVGDITFDSQKTATQNFGLPFQPAPGHTHFFLVNRAETGSDEGTSAAWENLLIGFGNRPEVSAILANGGKGAAQEFRTFIDQQIPVTVLRNQGRLSYLIEAALSAATMQEYQNLVQGNSDEITRQMQGILFSVLRTSDVDIDLGQGKDGQMVALETERNYQVIKNLLTTGSIQFIDV